MEARTTTFIFWLKECTIILNALFAFPPLETFPLCHQYLVVIDLTEKWITEEIFMQPVKTWEYINDFFMQISVDV